MTRITKKKLHKVKAMRGKARKKMRAMKLKYKNLRKNVEKTCEWQIVMGNLECPHGRT